MNSQVNKKKTVNSIGNGEGYKWQFTKEEIHNVNKQIKRCSNSLVIREVKIKSAITLHLLDRQKAEAG